MLDGIVITPKGLSLLERILRSCPPEFTNGGLLGKDCVLKAAKENKEMLFRELITAIGLRNSELNIFGRIYRKARGEVSSIDETFIANYFGGNPHIERVISWIEEQEDILNGLGEKYTAKSFVSHILLPVRVISINNAKIRTADAIYENGDVQVVLSKLIPFSGERLKEGQKVFCHHSSIISDQVPFGMEEMLLDAQAENKSFMDACKEISEEGIDHTKMISYPWAKKVLELERS